MSTLGKTSVLSNKCKKSAIVTAASPTTTLKKHSSKPHHVRHGRHKRGSSDRRKYMPGVRICCDCLATKQDVACPTVLTSNQSNDTPIQLKPNYPTNQPASQSNQPTNQPANQSTNQQGNNPSDHPASLTTNMQSSYECNGSLAIQPPTVTELASLPRHWTRATEDGARIQGPYIGNRPCRNRWCFHRATRDDRTKVQRPQTPNRPPHEPSNRPTIIRTSNRQSGQSSYQPMNRPTDRSNKQPDHPLKQPGEKLTNQSIASANTQPGQLHDQPTS